VHGKVGNTDSCIHGGGLGGNRRRITTGIKEKEGIGDESKSIIYIYIALDVTYISIKK
jgi:hypothetical protein